MSNVTDVVIGIATAGRREQLRLTFGELAQLQRQPSRVVVCPATPEDFDESSAALLPFPVEVVRGPKGLCAQRNCILKACRDADLIAFFDDDFYPAPDYLTEAAALFDQRPDVVVATHHPALDGATGPGVPHDDALAVIAHYRDSRPRSQTVRPTYAGYGCNMVIRLAPVREHGLWFDENLPLYGWLEDVDFTRRLARYGEVVVCERLRGVHLGTKKGKTSGVRLGYSQVANPVYMVQKGSVDFRYALKHIAKNVAKNAALSLKPEPWIDRVGRFRGNAIALGDLLKGSLHPQKAVGLE